MVQRIMVVDDDPTVTDVLDGYLRREGYEVAVAPDGEEALRLVRDWGPDLMILDLMLPRLDGLEVCRRLRRATRVPIIMLTARRGETDRVVGLEMGADDYVVKPFSPRELVARVRSVLRRATSDPDWDQSGSLRFDAITINPQTRRVRVNDRDVQLTAKEFDLLLFLAARRGRVFSRSQLMDQVWDYTYAGDASTVTVHVRRLREKIETDPTRPEHIKTVWGVGYKFDG